MSKEPVPPPTFGGPSPVPPPLPPRQQRARASSDETSEDEDVPLFMRRGQVESTTPQVAYDDVSEQYSDDELDEDIPKWKRLWIKTKRHTRKASAFAVKQAMLTKSELTSSGHKMFLTKKYIIQRFHDGASLAELIREGAPFQKLKEVLKFKTIDDLVELGIMEGETQLEPEFWSLFISDFDLCADDLFKFNLHNLEEYAEAGLTSDHLKSLGITLQQLTDQGRFTKECIEKAKAFGWTILDYQKLGLNYELLKRHAFQEDDYALLFDTARWYIASWLGMYDVDTHTVTEENRQLLAAINIYIV